MATISRGQRLEFLDAVRGVAALVVLIQHGAETYWPSFATFSHDVFNVGRLGVTLFFLTSGFIIPVSLERGGSVRRFALGRFFRLYPLYWLSLGLMLLISLGVPTALPSDYRENLAVNSAANLTMAQELAGFPHAIPLYYTLTLELVFYVSCSVLFAAGILRKTYGLAWAAVAGVAALGVGLPLIIGRRAPMAGAFYLMTMFFGTALYRAVTGALDRARIPPLAAALTAVAAAGAWVNYVKFPKTGGDDAFSFVAAATPWLGAYLLFGAALCARDKSWPAPMRYLGRISYSVYLMHTVILELTSDWPPWLALATLVAGTFVLASITYRVVEAPFLAMGRRLQRRARPVPTPEPAL